MGPNPAGSALAQAGYERAAAVCLLMLAPVFAASSHSIPTNAVPDRRTGRGMSLAIESPSITPVLSTKFQSQPLR